MWLFEVEGVEGIWGLISLRTKVYRGVGWLGQLRGNAVRLYSRNTASRSYEQPNYARRLRYSPHAVRSNSVIQSREAATLPKWMRSNARTGLKAFGQVKVSATVRTHGKQFFIVDTRRGVMLRTRPVIQPRVY